MHNIEPSIKSQSFTCPHCNALAHQYWYDVYVQETKSNKPNLLSPHEMSKLIKELSQLDNIPKEVSDKWIEQSIKQEKGLVFFEKLKDSEYSYIMADNIWLSKCYSCKKITVWVHENIIFPQRQYSVPANEDMPEDARHDYEEARQILNISPRGSAALLRLCIEKICRVLTKSSNNNLNGNIKFLVKAGLSEKLQQALDVLRVVGNESVHPGQIDLRDDKQTATNLFILVNMIVEQLITQPKLTQELFNSLPDNKRKGIKDRDNANK